MPNPDAVTNTDNVPLRLTTLTLDSLETTRRIGLLLGDSLPLRGVVLLAGELGAGKTTLVKAVCEALGVRPEVVTSPTYTLANVYPGRCPVYHVDLYRLETSEALLELDEDDWINPEGPTLIEWPEAARPLLAERELLELDLAHGAASPETREMILRAEPGFYDAVFDALFQAQEA